MCNFKNDYWSKTWYGHGRTGRTADDGPVLAYVLKADAKRILNESMLF